jgi:hypothetical protein
MGRSANLMIVVMMMMMMTGGTIPGQVINVGGVDSSNNLTCYRSSCFCTLGISE